MNRIYNLKSYVFILLGVLFLLSVSCNKYIVEEVETVDASTVTPNTIETDLAVINITVPQADFDYMMGNYTEDIEIVGHLTMFHFKKQIIKDQLIEISIKGSFTAEYPLKSLKIKFDKNQDNSTGSILNVEDKLANHHLDVIRNFSLRNSGNDFYESYIKDISYSQLAIDMKLDLELSYYRIVQVFVNDKFYGLLNMRTEKNRTALSKLMDVSKGDLNIIKINHIGGGVEELEYKHGDEAKMNELVTAVFSRNTTKLKELLDLQNVADYIAYQDFIGNSDWPFNNVEIYSVVDGKFRFFLYDLDFAGTRNKYFFLDDNPNGFVYNMFKALMEDDATKAMFEESQRKIVNYAHTSKFKQIVRANAHRIENEISYNISKYAVPSSHAEWYLELEKVQNQYELRRDEYIDYYGL